MAKPNVLDTNGLIFVPMKGKVPLYSWVKKGEHWPYDEAIQMALQRDGTGLGLIHSFSGTCALDIDDWEGAEKWLNSEFNMSLNDLQKDRHFEIKSPKTNRGKFVFKLPPSSMGIQSLDKCAKYSSINDSQIIDFRAGNHYDLWPGSFYKDTKEEYEHSGSTEIKDIPIEWIKVWLSVQNEKQSVNTNNFDGDSGDRQGHSRIQSEMEQAILTGKNMHDGLRSISQQMAYEGMPRHLIVLTLKGLLSESRGKEDRPDDWQKRWDNIELLVDGALQRAKERDGIDRQTLKEKLNSVSGSTDSSVGTEESSSSSSALMATFNRAAVPGVKGNGPGEMPWPPGLLGEFANNAFNHLQYQYREMAVVMAISIVSGITGRKFNISNTGLNLYFTILADSSVGKGSIKSFINRIVADEKLLGEASSFFRYGGVTSGKALLNQLTNSRSHLRIVDEAGVASLSKSGDPATANAAYLDLWAVSGRYDFADGKDYVGGEDNSIKSIRAPALSVLNVSTPDAYKEVFYKSNAIDNGMAARISIVNIDRYVKHNRKSRFDIHEDVINKLKYLAHVCSEVQAVDDPKSWDLIMPQSLFDEYQDLRDQFDRKKMELASERDNMASIYGRANLKMARYMGIATVFNKNKDDPECLVVDREAYDWAYDMIQYEIQNMEKFFTGKYFGNEFQEAIMRGKELIVKLMKGKYSGKNTKLSDKMKADQVFTISVFKKVCSSTRLIKELDDDPKYRSTPVSGAEKILKSMIAVGDVLELEKRQVEVKYGFKFGKCYQVLEGFYLDF